MPTSVRASLRLQLRLVSRPRFRFRIRALWTTSTRQRQLLLITGPACSRPLGTVPLLGRPRQGLLMRGLPLKPAAPAAFSWRPFARPLGARTDLAVKVSGTCFLAWRALQRGHWLIAYLPRATAVVLPHRALVPGPIAAIIDRVGHGVSVFHGSGVPHLPSDQKPVGLDKPRFPSGVFLVDVLALRPLGALPRVVVVSVDLQKHPRFDGLSPG